MKSLHCISLGAGVQSSTIALMAKHGEITPMPDVAVFADTGDEPKHVYEWLNYLKSQLPFPVLTTQKTYKGSPITLSKISTTERFSKNQKYYTSSAVPAFIVDVDGKVGLMMRQCTQTFKIEVIQKAIKQFYGKGSTVTQWIGISIDEASRMKDSRNASIINRYPLIEKMMSRKDCLDWLANNGYPKAPRSSCVFCPFHSNAEWKNLQENYPDDFAVAVQYEKDFQLANKRALRGTPYLHSSCKPLDTIDFSNNNKQQINLFENDCSGSCGV